MPPSATIVASAAAMTEVIDAEGRRLALRRMGVLDRLRLFKAAGPELSRNEAWLALAMIACSVTAIDDVPMPLPVNEALIEAAVSRLGDSGIAAAAEALAPAAPSIPQDMAAEAGN